MFFAANYFGRANYTRGQKLVRSIEMNVANLFRSQSKCCSLSTLLTLERSLSMVDTAKTANAATVKYALRTMVKQIECFIGVPTVRIDMLAQVQVAM
jgi:hypothetical protein